MAADPLESPRLRRHEVITRMIKARAAHAINAVDSADSIGRKKRRESPSRSIHDKSTLEFLRKRVENGGRSGVGSRWKYVERWRLDLGGIRRCENIGNCVGEKWRLLLSG